MAARAVVLLAMLAACQLAAAAAGPNRKLMQPNNNGPRKFETVDQHKNPDKPTLARKDFDMSARFAALGGSSAAATRNLLQGGGASNGGVGPRKFELVDQHKDPARPVLSRKSFEVATNMFHASTGNRKVL